MFKKILPITFILLFVISCALSLEGQVKQLESSFTGAVHMMVKARKPCVDETAPGVCLINDKAYRKISIVIREADEALDLANKFIANNQEDAAKRWIDVLKEKLAKITEFISEFRERL